MKTIEEIKQVLERRIENFNYWRGLETPSTQDIESHRSNCALLQMIKDMEALVALGDRERHKAVGDKAAESLQTLCNNWGK